jgi:DNA polymerase III sliding clamp (beta) subunit (PCNA family)
MMDRQELVKKLGLVSLALADNDLIPILKCFAFTGEDVIACNDTLGVTTPCPTEEAFCVHGKTLKELLENSHAETVVFKIEGDDLVVRTGKSTFKLPWFPIEDFLWLVPVDLEPIMELNEDLLIGLGQCLSTVSKDYTQLKMMGVRLHQGTLYSSDGDAFTRYVTDTKVAAKVDRLLPNDFCASLIKITEQSEASSGEISINDEWAAVELDSEFSIYGRLLEIDNPLDHEALIKRTLKAKPQFTKVPEGLDHALSRARVVADPESAKTVFTIKGGRLGLLTTASMGIIKDNLPFNGHSDVQANVSAARIQRCISLCDEMSVAENCCTFRSGSKLFILASNLGE